MNVLKLEVPTFAEQDDAGELPGREAIRVLDDFELLLAGGGDVIDSWP